MGVRVCEICKEGHDYKSGFFTRHLVDSHDITLEDYIILTEYNNIPPKCECGLCDDKPQFHRGKFRTHASGHRKVDFKKKMYLEKYGEPKCPTCDEHITKWYRGEPRKYCNIKCQPSMWNQDQVDETVRERYNVDNVFQLESVKEKSKETNLERYGVEFVSQSDEIKNKIKITRNDRYENGWFDSDKLKKTILERYGVEHMSHLPSFRESASKRMIEYNKNWFRNTTIKKYKDTEIYYQSSYELEFIKLCEEIGIFDKLENGNTYDINPSKRMLTDFCIGDFEIEIKSTFVMDRQGGIETVNEKRDEVISNGKKYIFILDKDYSEFLSIFSK